MGIDSNPFRVKPSHLSALSIELSLFCCAVHQLWYTTDMESTNFILTVNFYRTDAGNEPVRDWLKELPRDDKRIIGEDIKTAQLGWPLGMPLIRKMNKNLW